jgi:Ca2+-binding RTX toxin-like protein
MFAFGNGGGDTFDYDLASVTIVGGQGGDSVQGDVSSQGLYFLNEGNDTLDVGTPGSQSLTVFGGLGNDTIFTDDGRDTVQGNEGNDSLRGDDEIDTISGGSGNDVFVYNDADDDGNNATGGGPVEQITDLDWSVDRFDTTPNLSFAFNAGAGTGATLATSATNAINAAAALGGTQLVAAQFTFGGRTFLAMNTDGAANFADASDLLVDITGVTGTIGNGNFI